MGLLSNTVWFIAYLFVVVICYFVISTPVDMLFDAFVGSHAQVDSYIPLYKSFFTLFFSFWAAVPFVWLAARVFSREPHWSYRRY